MHVGRPDGVQQRGTGRRVQAGPLDHHIAGATGRTADGDTTRVGHGQRRAEAVEPRREEDGRAGCHRRDRGVQGPRGRDAHDATRWSGQRRRRLALPRAVGSLGCRSMLVPTMHPRERREGNDHEPCEVCAQRPALSRGRVSVGHVYQPWGSCRSGRK